MIGGDVSGGGWYSADEERTGVVARRALAISSLIWDLSNGFLIFFVTRLSRTRSCSFFVPSTGSAPEE